MNNNYIQHQGKVIITNSHFSHVMAIALNPTAQFKEGVIRCVTDRQGDVSVSGYIDRSELRLVKGNSLDNFEIGEKLNIQDENKIIENLENIEFDFIGLEDPDIWIDPSSKLLHLYFTLPLISRVEHSKNKINLGHAVGKDLYSLVMTEPVLLADNIGGAKELSIAPINKRGFRFNLVESSRREIDFNYSVIRTAIAHDMGSLWEFGKIIFHPKEHNLPWIAGHASPGPLLSKDFIDVGEGKLLGFINGREANKIIDDKTVYGIFSVGLFIYDYENGKIDWVSPKPFIRDTEAKTITFASEFVYTKKGEGVLYAHVDDSFVRAYTLDVEKIKEWMKLFI